MINEKKEINQNINWGLNSEMDALINGIDISSEKRVLMTAGDKQYIYDDGQIYSTNTKCYDKGKMLTREQFREQAQEIKINYMCNRKNDIIIE